MQIFFQVLAGVGRRAGGHGLRRPGADQGAAAGAALRSQVDEPVGGLDHVQVVLDDQHRVSGVHQPLQNLQQLLHIVGVQARGGLVQDIEGAARGPAGQLRGQLHPLGLAAGQGGGGLAQLHIAQAHVAQGAELFGDFRHRGEELQGLLRRHVQHVGDALALVAHLQGLPVIALAAAHLAGDVYVGQEVHLDFQHTVAAAGLAPAALGVEGEPPRAIAPGLGLLGGGEQGADLVEQARVGGGIGAGRPADGALVDAHHLVQILLPLQGVTAFRLELHLTFINCNNHVFMMGKNFLLSIELRHNQRTAFASEKHPVS